MWLFSECSNLLPPDRPRQPEATFEAEGGDWDENREQSHWTGTGLDEDGQLQVQNSRSPMRREYVSAVMLDCGDMYELNESVWDVLMFAGHPAIGSLNTSVLWGIYVLNLALQCMFIFLVQHLLMEEVISPQNLDGLLKFRLGLAHRAEYADKVTERSMAAQVCSFDRKLHLAGEQVDLFRDLNDFATGGLPAKLLICFIQYLWLCTILKDIENTFSIMTAVWRIPKGRFTRMVLADLRDDNDDIESTSSSSSDRDHGTDLAGFMKVVRIISMALLRKILVITAVGIPKTCLAVLLYLVGAMWLANTINFSELILNGVALAFVLEFDEVLYSVFVPRRSKTLMSNLEPLPFRRPNPGSAWSGTCSVSTVVFIIVVMFAVYFLLLQRVFWELEMGHSIVCSGNQDFIYAVNPATQMVHVASTTGENVYTDTEEIIAQVAQVVIHDHPYWDGFVDQAIFDATVSDFDRAVHAHGTAAASFDSIIQMSVSSMAEAALTLPCRDLASGQSQEASLKTLQVLLARDGLVSNISSCSDILRDYCAFQNKTWLRAICPRHCRCEETLLSNTGFFQMPEFGCPSQCETFKAAKNEIDFRFRLTKLKTARRLHARGPDEADQRLWEASEAADQRRLSPDDPSDIANLTATSTETTTPRDQDWTVADPGGCRNSTVLTSVFEGCADLHAADLGFGGGCSDSNGETRVDKNGNDYDCTVYALAPEGCGSADDDFQAAEHCCACGGGYGDGRSSLECYDHFTEACWRLPPKAIVFVLYVSGLFEYSMRVPGFREGVANVVETDYAGIAPDEATQIELIEQIATGEMARSLAGGSWDLVPGLPHPRGLTGCDFLASYEVTSLLNLDLCADGVHQHIKFLCPVACGCDESKGLDECPAACVLTRCYDDAAEEACVHVHPWYSEECIAGYHNDGGLPTCYKCTDGETRRRRSTSCTECPDGHYDLGNLDDCVQCLDGQTRRRRSTSCTDCDPGTYDAGDNDQCTSCLGGTTRRRRATACTDCPGGTYKSENMTSDECAAALSCSTTRRRSAVCTDCHPGYYNDGSSDDCVQCEGGSTRRRAVVGGAVECTPCEAGKRDDGDSDDCSDVSCPANSVATANGNGVADGCVCDAGYVGSIRAIEGYPYYSGRCVRIPVHTRDDGYCQWPIAADQDLCSLAAQELGLTTSAFVNVESVSYGLYGCAVDTYMWDSRPTLNIAGEYYCGYGGATCVCIGTGHETTCADREPNTGCPQEGQIDSGNTYNDWYNNCYLGDSAESCCGCKGGGVYTKQLYELCADTNDGAMSFEQEGTDLSGCLKWDWYPSTCEWATYYDDADFSPADMCCACGGGRRWTTSASSTTSVSTTSESSTTTGHTTTESSTLTSTTGTSSTMSSSTTEHTTSATSTTNPFIVSGDCTSSDGCVRSANYPYDYGNSESCIITLRSASVWLTPTWFYTEENYDWVQLNGAAWYSGYGWNGDDPFEVTSTIYWTSDFAVTRSGWQFCLA